MFLVCQILVYLAGKWRHRAGAISIFLSHLISNDDSFWKSFPRGYAILVLTKGFFLLLTKSNRMAENSNRYIFLIGSTTKPSRRMHDACTARVSCMNLVRMAPLATSLSGWSIRPIVPRSWHITSYFIIIIIIFLYLSILHCFHSLRTLSSSPRPKSTVVCNALHSLCFLQDYLELQRHTINEGFPGQPTTKKQNNLLYEWHLPTDEPV